MALVAAAIANRGVMPDPYLVRDVRAHAADPASGSERSRARGVRRRRAPVRQRGGGERRCAAPWWTRSQGPLGRLYAGAGAVSLYGISGVETAGKTGTAELGPDRAAALVVHRLRARPGWRHPGHRHRRHRRGRRQRIGSRGTHRRRGDGRMAEAPGRRRMNPRVTGWGIVMERQHGPRPLSMKRFGW